MNSFDQPKQEKQSIARELRKAIPWQFLVGFGISISAVVVQEGFNINEYLELKNKSEKLKKEISVLEPNNKKIKEIYGIDFGEKRKLDSNLEDTEDRIKNFSWWKDSLTPQIENLFKKNNSEGQNNEFGEKSPPKIKSIPSVIRYHDEENDFLNEGGMDSSFIAEVLTKTFPNNWASNIEVSVIKYEDKVKNISEGYNIKGGKAWADYNPNTKNITFYQGTKNYPIYENINICLTHELGHANDWDTDNETSVDDKMVLLVSIAERLDSPDRYMSSYVESIGIPDTTKEIAEGTTYYSNAHQRQKYNKAKEYWGEICSVYFSSPGLLNVKDFELVDNWVKKNDPTFNLEKSIELRSEMIKDYSKHAGK